MPLKDILVHIDNAPECAGRLEYALGLAAAHEAHLTGVYVVPQAFIPAYAEVHITQEIMDAQEHAAHQAMDKAETAFREAADRAGIPAEWRAKPGDVGRVLGFHCRYADVTVMSQPNPDDQLFAGDRDMPDRLILTAGRPVLVLPYTGAPATYGKNIMIAWDAGSLASKAVHDALHLLQEAEKVTVVVVNPDTESESDQHIPGADISAHLARHGVKVEASHAVAKDVDTGDMLLNTAADLGADMIVMGAYSHARWSELILGGVTSKILNNMTVPVMMSH